MIPWSEFSCLSCGRLCCVVPAVDEKAWQFLAAGAIENNRGSGVTPGHPPTCARCKGRLYVSDTYQAMEDPRFRRTGPKPPRRRVPGHDPG
jgi:hypothetical protein